MSVSANFFCVAEDADVVLITCDARGNLIKPDFRVPVDARSVFVLHQVTPRDLGAMCRHMTLNTHKQWLGGERGFLTLLRNTLELDCQDSGAMARYFHKISSSIHTKQRQPALEKALKLIGLFGKLGETNQLDTAEEHAAMAVELYIHLCIALS